MKEDYFTPYVKLASKSCCPVSVQVEVTSKCHQACKHCFSWRSPYKEEWVVEELLRFSRRLRDLGCESLSLTGGDPLAWDLVNYLENYDVGIGLRVSTALAIDPDQRLLNAMEGKVSEVRVSLDACSENLYEELRGVRFDRESLRNRMRSIAEVGVGLSVNCCLTKYNLDEIPLIVEFCSSLGVRKLALTGVLGEKEALPSLPELAKFKRFTDLPWVDVCLPPILGDQSIPCGTRCWNGRISCHIKPDGSVYPCCLIGGEAAETNEQLILGNAKEEDILSLMKRFVLSLMYDNYAFCRMYCLEKQIQLNLACEKYADTEIRIP